MINIQIKFKKFFVIFNLIFFSIPLLASEENAWFAGTEYIGEVIVNNIKWVCSGGTCILKGNYGQGLNMLVCQELSKKVGGLEYYYNDYGMIWAKTKNSPLLEQCNSY